MAANKKVCSKCHEEKLLSEFYPNSSHGKKGYHSSCKECDKAAREQGTDLSGLLSISNRASKNAWTLPEMKKILKVYVNLRNRGVGVNESVEQIKLEKRKPSAIKNIVSEMYRAAKAGMTLEAYYAAGRPFKNGGKPAKVLVEAKKK